MPARDDLPAPAPAPPPPSPGLPWVAEAVAAELRRVGAGLVAPPPAGPALHWLLGLLFADLPEDRGAGAPVRLAAALVAGDAGGALRRHARGAAAGDDRGGPGAP